MSDTERWMPDLALVLAVRYRSLPIADLSGPDRAWIVAALTVQGWTVASIADRLKCSLRLIQQIKAEPMTQVSLYALALEQAVREEKSLRYLECRQHTTEMAAVQHTVDRLLRQRDMLLDRLARPREEED